MKKLLKITLTLSIGIVMSVGMFMPELLLGTPASPAVGNWYQQFLPNLNGEPISDVFFLDSLVGFAVTGDGSPNDSNYILKTTNGGNNWQIKHTAYRDFFKITFINQNTGFVCGGFNSLGNIIFKSTDGGNNWFHVITPAVIYANDISVLNEDTLWYVENDSFEGGVFRTTNGGVNWTVQTGPSSHIYMYNARIGFVDGLKRTTNSGATWVTIPAEPSLFFDMHFTDSLTGWKCHQQMKKTTDGGLTWLNQTLPTGGSIILNYVLKFSNINKDTIWGSGGVINTPSGLRGMLFRTTNGGQNWLFQLPDTSIHSGQYMHIQFINKNIGWSYWPASGIHTTLGGDTTFLVGIQQISNTVPEKFKLYQNYPNPFNPATNIKYTVKRQTSNVKLVVYDIQGKLITELVNQKQNAGTYEVDWNASAYSSGLYFYKLTVNNGKEVFTDTKKMMLIK